MSQDQMEQTRIGNNPLSPKEIILLEWNDSYFWLGHRKNRKITMLAVEAFNLSTKTPIFFRRKSCAKPTSTISKFPSISGYKLRCNEPFIIYVQFDVHHYSRSINSNLSDRFRTFNLIISVNLHHILPRIALRLASNLCLTVKACLFRHMLTGAWFSKSG